MLLTVVPVPVARPSVQARVQLTELALRKTLMVCVSRVGLLAFEERTVLTLLRRCLLERVRMVISACPFLATLAWKLPPVVLPALTKPSRLLRTRKVRFARRLKVCSVLTRLLSLLLTTVLVVSGAVLSQHVAPRAVTLRQLLIETLKCLLWI